MVAQIKDPFSLTNVAIYISSNGEAMVFHGQIINKLFNTFDTLSWNWPDSDRC